jgi:DNA adenine methylase
MSLIEESAGPLVKWAGGKGKILPHLEACLPGAFSRYFEPFCGGAALFFHLSSISDLDSAARPAHIGDANADLIELYQQVARDASGVHAETCEMIDRHVADPIGCYYSWRAAWNAERYRWSAARRASVFLYLNRSSFNGLFRLNRSGHMNVPIGRASVEGQPHPVKLPLARMVSSGMALSRAKIRCSDYVELIAEAGAGDLVYLDPPYIPKSGTASFVAYTSGGFGASDHGDLARRALDLAGRGVLVMVSSSDVPGARDLYPGFFVHELSVSRSVSAASGGRAKVGELILTSYPVAIGSASPSVDSKGRGG